MALPLQEGDILAGKYRVERVLAQGGMGVIVAAIHQQLEQRVALKFLLPEGAQNEATMSRFLREAKAAVRLRSEHVARVLDVGTAENGPYIVMEYLEGRDLAAVLDDEGRLEAHVAVTYVLQAAEAVAEAHALGIVHRDLKPANLFLTKRADGTPCVKVLDFGISKLTTDLSTTKTTAVMGTPYYMSPEQLQASRNVDVRSDIWSLGMILYELLTGTVAFRRETLPALCTAILLEPVPSARELVPDVPEGLEAIVLRTLAKAPADRYQSLAELSTDLAEFAPDGQRFAMRVRRVLGAAPRPSTAPRDDRSARATTSSTRAPSASSPELAPSSSELDRAAVGSPPPAPEAITRRRVALVAGVLLLGTFAGLTWSALHAPRPPPSRSEPAVGGSAPPSPAEPSAEPSAASETPSQTSPPLSTESPSSPPSTLLSPRSIKPQRAPRPSTRDDELFGPRK